MNDYTITYRLTEIRTVTVEAESESAARQAWVDEADELDAGPSSLCETESLELLSIDGNDVEPLTFAEQDNTEENGAYLDGLLAEYGSNPHYADGGVDGIDRTDRYLLVEENVRGGYWLTSNDNVKGAIATHYGQEYAGDWEIVGLFDLVEERKVEFNVRHEVEVSEERPAAIGGAGGSDEWTALVAPEAVPEREQGK